jgi:hypothetical protein
MLHRVCDGQQEITPSNEPGIVTMRSISSAASGRQRRQATLGSCATVDSSVEDRWETVATEPFCFPDLSTHPNCQAVQTPDCKNAPSPRAKLKRRASYESLRSDPLPIFTSQVVPCGTRRLQLPPFDSLGLGRPAAEQILSPISPPTSLPRQSLSFDSKLAAVAARLSTASLTRSSPPPKDHRSSTLPPTPPAEDECIGWDIHSGGVLTSEQTTTLSSETSSRMEEERTSQTIPLVEPVKESFLPPDNQPTNQQDGNEEKTVNGDGIIQQEGVSEFWLEKGIESAGIYLTTVHGSLLRGQC